MEMTIEFPGGTRVAAHFGSHTVMTDLPVGSGGGDSAPSPFDTFLASIGTCAGIYVLGFCRQRGIPTEGIRLVQRARMNPATMLAEAITLEILLPADFPAAYRAGVVRAAEQCKVKKHFENPPVITVSAPAAKAAMA